MKRKPQHPITPLGVALVALTAAFADAAPAAPSEVRIIPAGEFRAWDGRPTECAAWVCTDDDGARLAAEIAAFESARVIDYEHATLHAKKTGAKAPAAGWFERVEWRSGDGLYMVGIDWTACAAQEIADKAYRYVSPLFSYDATSGRVLHLRCVSLTNDPGLDGLTDLAALAAELFPTTNPQEDSAMDELLERLRWLLNLPVASPVEDIKAHLEKVINQLPTTAVAANSAFNLGEHLAALAAQVETPDPAKFAPVAALTALQGEHAELQTRFAALQADVDGAKLDKVVADGLAAGKLTPATEAWARTLGKTNLAALSSFLDAAPEIVKPGGTQTGGAKPAAADPDDPVAIAALASDYQAAQAAKGITISTVHAVAHVTKKGD